MAVSSRIKEEIHWKHNSLVLHKAFALNIKAMEIVVTSEVAARTEPYKIN